MIPCAFKSLYVFGVVSVYTLLQSLEQDTSTINQDEPTHLETILSQYHELIYLTSQIPTRHPFLISLTPRLEALTTKINHCHTALSHFTNPGIISSLISLISLMGNVAELPAAFSN